MDKKKIQNAQDLRKCARVMACVEIVMAVVAFFALCNFYGSGWGAIAAAAVIGLSAAISYFTLIVLADISGSLAGEVEEEEKTSEEKGGKDSVE